MVRKALFLDRDGVINRDYGYVHAISDFHFMPDIFDLCRAAIEKNYILIVVTNQAGIGRGFYDESAFVQLTHWMEQRFIEENCEISKVYFSPYHPKEGKGKYLKDDFSRKPNPGMILRAKEEFGIGLNSSLLVGDKTTDILAGKRAGVGINLLYDPESKAEAKEPFLVASLKDVISFL